MGQVCCKSQKVKDDAGDVDGDNNSNKVEVDFDTEELNRIRDALHNNLETFLLDYVLMSVQFFENYERDSEILREKCLEEIRLTTHGKKCFYADTLHELVATKVTFQPKHGAKKNLEELLHPIRIYLTYENVEASYEQDDNAIRPKEKPYYKLIVEDCIDTKKKNAGYVNLVESESYEDERPSVTEGISRNNSFNLHLYNHTPGVQTPRKRSTKFSFRKSKPKFLTDTEKRLSMTLSSSPRISSFSRLSTVHSGRKEQIRKILSDQVIAQHDNYWCTTYEKVTKPRLVDDYRINNVPQTSTSIPKLCFQKIEQPLYKDKRRLGMTTGRPLEAIVSHNVLNSSAFKGHFCDVFVERIAENLDFDTKELHDAKVQGSSIIWKKNKTTYQITPIIELKSWPECGTEFMRPVDKDPSQLPWPTIYLQKCVKNQGLSLTPVGYLEFREENTDYEKEWKIECPKGEKYLQLHLLHAQIRCYLFSLALYKAFIEVEEESSSFGPHHLLHLLFWEVKKNYLWPEAEAGFTFIRFLKVLYNKLQHRKLRDFFIHHRNLFGSSPAKDINRVLGRINLILENPVPYILLTIRNLKFKPNFYPKLNCSRLFKLVTEKDILTFLNPNLVIFRKSVLDSIVTEEDEILEEDYEEDREKFVRAQLRKQIESERVANELLAESRKSVDSIDVKAALVLDSKALRRQEILRCFIPHFIEMAVKSKEYQALDQCLMYLLHAKRLTQLLAEEQVDKSETYRYFERIDSIKLRCEKLKLKLTKGEDDENENNENEENKNVKTEEVKVEEKKDVPEAKKVVLEEKKDVLEEVMLDQAKESNEKNETIAEETDEIKNLEENKIEVANPALAENADINNSNIESKNEEKVVEKIMEEEDFDTKL